MPTQKTPGSGTERNRPSETSRQGGNMDKERERSSDMGRQGGQQQNPEQQKPGGGRR